MILLGDCVVLMAQMEPGSVDAIVADPPYAPEIGTGPRKAGL